MLIGAKRLMVFYRKYRPQKIDDLDSQNIRESLYSIFSKSDIPHAFLFSGPKGLGKTSAARIVAKVINCEKHNKIPSPKSQISKEIEPCNKCGECVSITKGTNFDVLEIDAASNRGIDEIRDLKEKINLLPSHAAKKIYIIDEVHMLTTEAFNALLKTLEEPPSHAVFILCTTELHKVPETIISRCFRVNFTKATEEEFTRSLNRIVKAEEIKIDKEVIVEIAKMSDGSFRDATKILEELVLSAGKKTITTEMLAEKYNTLGIEKSLDELIKVFKNKNTDKGFEIIQKLSEQGMDFKFFLEKLLDKFHIMLLAKNGVGEKRETEFELAEIKKILELLVKAYQETKYAFLPSLSLELVLVEVTAFSSPQNELAHGSTSNAKSSNSFDKDFINEVKIHNNLLAGVLRSCDINVGKSENLEIIAISKFHKEKLEEAKSMLILKEVAKKLLGKTMTVSVILRG